jgi:hypothetical protein
MNRVDRGAVRAFAAEYLARLDRPDLARMVLAGQGDDFPEVIAAAALLARQAVQAERHVAALRAYADADFWDEDLPGGSLASHDRGEIARNVLAGRTPFHHRD